MSRLSDEVSPGARIEDRKIILFFEVRKAGSMPHPVPLPFPHNVNHLQSAFPQARFAAVKILTQLFGIIYENQTVLVAFRGNEVITVKKLCVSRYASAFGFPT
jgi:hypothetical protein